MNRFLISARWQVALRLIAPIVLGVLAVGLTRPAAAQKQVFDRKKPHVNVSGAAFEWPGILTVEPDSTAARSAGGRVADGDILVFDIVDSVARDSAAADSVLLDTSLGLIEFVIDEAFVGDDEIVVVAGEVGFLSTESTMFEPIATHGYIRIKKLSSGG